MWTRIKSLFRPLDTSEVDRAIALAECEHRQVRIRARALRMDVSCGDASVVIHRAREKLAATGMFLQRRWAVEGETPRDMLRLTERIG